MIISMGSGCHDPAPVCFIVSLILTWLLTCHAVPQLLPVVPVYGLVDSLSSALIT